MANTLTPLVPFVVASFQRVLRQTGAVLGMVNKSISPDLAARGQTIEIPTVAPKDTYNVTPAAVPPALLDETVGSGQLVLDQFKGTRFHVTGEDWKAMARMGNEFVVTQIDQKVSDIVNEAAGFVSGLAASAGGYAAGAAGTDPFATNGDILPDLAYFLDEATAPDDGRGLMLSPRVFRNMFKVDEFKRLSEAPQGTVFASGQVRDLQGLRVGWDQSIASHTAGAGTGYLTNGVVDVGDTTIDVDTGSDTILPGDVISFAGITTKYVVRSFAAGTITLSVPVLEAIGDGIAMTIAGGRRNYALHRDAIYWAGRPPAEVPGGDMASAVQIVTDPVTGLSMRLAEYGGYHARQYELSMLYGAKVIRPSLLVPLLS